MTAMGMVFYVLAPSMFRLFCPADAQTPIVEAGVPVLRLVAFAMPPLACIIIFTGALRGAGDTTLPMLLTWIGFLGIRIPLAWLLIFDSAGWIADGYLPAWTGGLFGAWLAMFADLLVRGGCYLLRFAGGRWKSIKV
jgi:Na+-driven multidrug efflux pump